MITIKYTALLKALRLLNFSAGGGDNTFRPPQNQDQCTNETFHLVEKALKIGRCAIILCHIHWSLLCCWILFELLAF